MTTTDYPFVALSIRAQCVRVIDGDTLDLFTDEGKHHYALHRYRLLGIDTCELTSTDPEKREKAKAAKEKVTAWCRPSGNAVDLSRWPLRVVTHKAPDSFGRWLANVFWTDGDGVERNVSEELLKLGLAVPFVR